MSVVRIVYVSCDGCRRCFSDAGDEGATATEQRRWLRREGWRTGMPGGRDLCDDCAEALEGDQP